MEASVPYQSNGTDEHHEAEISGAGALGGAGEIPFARERRDMFAYWLLFKARWRTIAALCAGASVVTFVVAAYILTPYYRADAVIRPVAQPGAQLSTLGQEVGTALSTFGAATGGGDDRAQEYMSILRSYEFNIALIGRYHLKIGSQRQRGWFGLGSRELASNWSRYRTMRKRFDCQYDYVTGNVTLHFLDRSPIRAEQILGFYLESLRDKLRREQVSSAGAAATALRAKALATSDMLLQGQLYDLMARQLQREKLAQVEADFAFKVIDGPVVPDVPYSPRPLLDAILMGLGVVAAALLWIAVRDYFERSHAAYMKALAAARAARADRKYAEGP